MAIEGIRAIIGNFHLIDASKERIEKTINGFLEVDVEEVYTGHCTGLKAEVAFWRSMAETTLSEF
ncbi:hypothetical protein E3E35_08130 [Thermococcus sp. GR7]|uniref:hypothetical protein n=1 Tax=unclassified Thermococcus TaxID=2627626 RepID=UPI00142FC28B|nr:MULTISPECIES: hypothetical protein [unclassified Thermococcus]NJE47364.1 hypothetical protein [Thermococcus sp. GR7]NJE78859.1 hypothetical protein [Thermococcus sp. GR4]NJF23146.1 hypothetical protein [Thermococcus sp. GR5]